MAEIPVQRRGSVPWWVWLLLAVLAAALLFWMFADDGEEVAAVDSPAIVADGGPVTSIDTLLGAQSAALVGRQVRLEDVMVQEVVGDRGFYIGPTADQSVFVVLNQVPTPGTPTEGRYDVTPGQMIDVRGVMREVTDPAFADRPIEGLPSGTQVVLHANSLEI